MTLHPKHRKYREGAPIHYRGREPSRPAQGKRSEGPRTPSRGLSEQIQRRNPSHHVKFFCRGWKSDLWPFEKQYLSGRSQSKDSNHQDRLFWYIFTLLNNWISIYKPKFNQTASKVLFYNFHELNFNGNFHSFCRKITYFANFELLRKEAISCIAY